MEVHKPQFQEESRLFQGAVHFHVGGRVIVQIL